MMTTHLIRVVYVLHWTTLARQAFAIDVEDALPGKNAAEAGEEALEWNDIFNRGFPPGDFSPNEMDRVQMARILVNNLPDC